MTVLAVGGQVDGIAGLLQRALQLLAVCRLIFVDQDAHVPSPGFSPFGNGAET
jgi:hypothetical protein